MLPILAAMYFINRYDRVNRGELFDIYYRKLEDCVYALDLPEELNDMIFEYTTLSKAYLSYYYR